MGTKAAVGRSVNFDSYVAGRDAALAAQAGLGDDTAKGVHGGLTLVFATAGHDQEALMAGVTSVLGAANVSGCSGEGVISAAGSDESSHSVAVLAIASDEMRFRTYNVPGFREHSRAAGEALADALGGNAREESLLLLFPDGIGGNCRELIAALEEKLPALPAMAGGTAGDMLRFEKTFQYHDGAVLSDSLSAVLIDGAFDTELIISHGCDLIGQEHTVTRADDCFVYEIDDRSAWSLFKTYLADDASGLEAMHLAHMVLAEHVEVDDADRTAAVEHFAPRVPVSLDADAGALYFAAGLETGTIVQLGLRNPEKVIEHGEDVARALLERRAGQKPLFVIQLDCAGRGRLLFDDRASESMVHPIRRILGEDLPWIGLHTFGEIAPIGGKTVFCNYTGVLCAIYPKSAADD